MKINASETFTIILITYSVMQSVSSLSGNTQKPENIAKKHFLYALVFNTLFSPVWISSEILTLVLHINTCYLMFMSGGLT